MGYKSKLVFYVYTEKVNKEYKNRNVRQQQQKFEGAITQKRYTKKILSIIARRKRLLELEDKEIIFQEDNNESHGTRSSENCCVYAKDEIKLNYIDD